MMVPTSLNRTLFVATGYGPVASDGVLRCTIPNGTVIPPLGYFLCVNSVGYSRVVPDLRQR